MIALNSLKCRQNWFLRKFHFCRAGRDWICFFFNVWLCNSWNGSLVNFDIILVAIVSKDAVSILPAFKLLHFSTINLIIPGYHLFLLSSAPWEITSSIVQIYYFFKIQSRVSPLLHLSLSLNLDLGDSWYLLLLFITFSLFNRLVLDLFIYPVVQLHVLLLLSGIRRFLRYIPFSLNSSPCLGLLALFFLLCIPFFLKSTFHFLSLQVFSLLNLKVLI